MSALVNASYAAEGITVAISAFAVALVYFLKGNISARTFTLMDQNRQALEERIVLLEASHASNMSRITELEAEVTTIKTIPLKEMAADYNVISTHLEGLLTTQNHILSTQNAILAALGNRMAT